jgi:Tetratricopeptide repeat
VLTTVSVGAVRFVRGPEPAPVVTPPPPEAPAPVAVQTPPARVRSAAPPVVVEVPVVVDEPEPPVKAHPVRPRRVEPIEPPPPAPAVSVPVVRTASELFSAANNARVRGETDEAIRISRELVDRYPDSPESAIARQSLGMLYLQTDKPELALAEFRQSRSPEAMWGEAQALRALGRSADERAALEALLARYPNAAYGAAARKRVEALRGH